MSHVEWNIQKKDTRMCESVFEEENKNEKVNVIRILVSDLWKWVEMSRNVTKSQITWKHISTRIDSVSLSYHAPKINGVCNIGIFLLSFSLPCEFMLIYNISEIGISWINYRKLGKKTARKSKAKQNKRKPKQIAIKCKRFLWIKFGNQKVFVNAYFDKRLKKAEIPTQSHHIVS